MSGGLPTWAHTVPNNNAAGPNRRHCGHCLDSGMVGSDNGLDGLPCPMCMVGMRVSAHWFGTAETGMPREVPFWSQRDVRRVTWQNGLTIDHRYTCRREIVLASGAKVVCETPAVRGDDGRDLCDHCRRVIEYPSLGGTPAAPLSVKVAALRTEPVVTPQEQAAMEATKGQNKWAARA